jgi:hypothetical protein
MVLYQLMRGPLKVRLLLPGKKAAGPKRVLRLACGWIGDF